MTTPAPETSQPPPSPDSFGRYAGMGLQFGAVVIVLALVGAWADKRLGTAPLCLIAGVMLGFLGATISIVRRAPSSRRPAARPTRSDHP